MKSHLRLTLLILLFSCSEAEQSKAPLKSHDDSVFLLTKQIDSIKHTYQVGEREYGILYDLADRIKPHCDNFQGSDKSKLPKIYNFCAEMFRRRCYLDNGRPFTIKECQYRKILIDCCLKAIPISKSLGDTLSLTYTNSLGFLADAYSQLDNIEESLKLRLEILSKYEQMYPGMSDMPMFANYDVGKTYELKGEIGKANEYFRKVLAYQIKARSKFMTETVAKKAYHKEMYKIANQLWTKYCEGLSKPSDSLLLIKTVIDKISHNHVAAAKVFDTLNKQVQDLKRFVVQKNLFDFDTTAPIVVRKTPAFRVGFSSMASATVPAPYQKDSVAFYNIADLSAVPPDKAESQLREHNDYILQILTIHEAVPGHCMQGIYNSRKSPDIVKSVFRNFAMIEGWAVYTQRMMLENGWGNNAPEMWLMFYKWSLRECCNVIVDYGIHCLNYTKEDIIKLLRNEAFQEEAQLEEKYHRATVSQVQLCSYFTGATEILALREAYKKKIGSKYDLKNFHEQFLSYGSAPVKFIREAMLKK